MSREAQPITPNGSGSSSGRVRSRVELETLVLQTAHEAFISMEANGVITEWNPEAERTFGWSRSEALGRTVAETIIPSRLREAHRAGLKRFLATGEERMSNRRVEVVAAHRDGREFPVELTIAPVAIDGGHAFNAFLRDVSDQKRLGRYLAAQNAANGVLVGSAPLAETMPALLEALGESLDWQLGAYWRVDEEAQVLRCEHTWSDPALAADEFVALSYETAFAPGVGLPGRVWQSGEAAWVGDLLADSNFPRATSGARARLRAATCFPVKNEGKVVGVIEFFCEELRQDDAGLLVLYEQVSNQVASFLERKRIEDTLVQEGGFLQAVLDSVEDGIVACDLNGVLTVFNRAARALHGLPARALPAEEWAEHYDLYHADGTTPMATEDIPLFRALQGGRVRNYEMVIAPKNREKRLLLANGQPILDGDGNRRGAVVAMHDITDRKRAEDKLAHQAMHDPLTGLPNRMLLLDRTRHALELSKRLGSTIAVLLLDLDHFKSINDRFGREGGDRTLSQVGARLESLLRGSDTISRPGGATMARVGGDTFAILCEGLKTERDAIQIADRVSASLGAPFPFEGAQLGLTASIGIAMPTGLEEDADSLIRDAGVAMYRAKDQGRDRHEIFRTDMRTSVLERLQIENDLRLAIERAELTLRYQPIVATSDQRIVGVEGLIRWEHPTRGLISPAEFIPLAEETGLIVPIGAWILQEACRQAARWDRSYPQRPPVYISVNVSARQLTIDLLDTVSRALEESGLHPRRLVIEITESVMVERAESAQLVRALRERGVQLALDDFGTGYSSLSYLTRFRYDILKIDRSLVSSVDVDEQGARVTAAAIEMGQALGMTVIGEGIETTAQLDRLTDLGCEFAQGYLFARPQPAEAIDLLLTQSENAHGRLGPK